LGHRAPVERLGARGEAELLQRHRGKFHRIEGARFEPEGGGEDGKRLRVSAGHARSVPADNQAGEKAARLLPERSHLGVQLLRCCRFRCLGRDCLRQQRGCLCGFLQRSAAPVTGAEDEPDPTRGEHHIGRLDPPPLSREMAGVRNFRCGGGGNSGRNRPKVWRAAVYLGSCLRQSKASRRVLSITRAEEQNNKKTRGMKGVAGCHTLRHLSCDCPGRCLSAACCPFFRSKIASLKSLLKFQQTYLLSIF